MIERVTEVDEVVVGRTYLVPCLLSNQGAVKDAYGNVERIPPRYLPVLGVEHSDAEFIRFPEPHWHFDARFLPEDYCVAFLGRPYDRWRVRLPDDVRVLQIVQNSTFLESKDVVWREMECLRQMPTYPAETDSGPVFWLPDLEDAFASAKVDCRTCPHRGTPLSGLPVKDGVVVCPSHGLAWDVATGKMVRRSSKATRLGAIVP